MARPCSCGSNLDRYELVDAAGIFCTYVCDKCEDEKKKQFNPSIFEQGSPYARSGDEEDIFADRYGDY
jgi:hypothetical protein